MTFDRAAWLEWRRMGIGASDIAAIVGLSPWQSAYSLWAEKCSLIEGQAETEAMAHGRYAERTIEAWWTDTHRDLRIVGGPWLRCEHPDDRWARCTPDGLLVENVSPDDNGKYPVWLEWLDRAVGLIEYKVADFKIWDEIPDYYQCQAQWQMYVAGQASVTFAVQHGKRFATYVLERDEDDIAYLRDAAESFWHDFVCAGVAPSVDHHQATGAALNHRWQASDNSVDLNGEIALALEELHNAKAEQKWWEAHRAHLENRIKEALGDASIGRVDGRVAVTWKSSTTERIDSKALRAAHPDIAKEFTTVTEARRFLLKESK